MFHVLLGPQVELGPGVPIQHSVGAQPQRGLEPNCSPRALNPSSPHDENSDDQAVRWHTHDSPHDDDEQELGGRAHGPHDGPHDRNWEAVPMGNRSLIDWWVAPAVTTWNAVTATVAVP